jgi:AraC family transcriptional regulator of adaptative response/methylated-DNA-[protein]-cysteine methyltransferase
MDTQLESVSFEQMEEDYRRIGAALEFLHENAERRPELAEAAAAVGLSEYHFQRVFTRWVGISPKRFLQFLSKEHVRGLLEGSAGLLEAAYSSGLSGPGRLHDLLVTTEALTPGQIRRRGEGLEISYGFHPGPFGEFLLAVTERGICQLAFSDPGGREAAVRELTRRWPSAHTLENSQRTQAYAERLNRLLTRECGEPLPVHLTGTNFQIKVWEALMRIPDGRVVSYEDVAAATGHPKAVRAAGSAIGANPAPLLIPCHRVIRKMGVLGEYAYGATRKEAILGWELARY